MTTLSSNKFRYYDVTTTTTVRALNKTEAVAVASGRRGANGNILATEAYVDHITAAEAQSVQS